LLTGLGERGRAEESDAASALVRTVAARRPLPPSPRRRRALLLLTVGALVAVVSTALVLVVRDDPPGRGGEAGEAVPVRTAAAELALPDPPPRPDRAAHAAGPVAASVFVAAGLDVKSGAAARAAGGEPRRAAASGAAHWVDAVDRSPRRDGGVAPPHAAAAGAAASAASDTLHRDGGAVAAAGDAGPKHTDPKSASVSDFSRRGAPWERPPGDDDSNLKHVARFSATGGSLLKGRVVDAESGRPVGGTAIEAHLGDSFMETSTDPAGAFRMSGLLPGTRVTVWVVGRPEVFVAECIDLAIPGEGETADAGVIRLLRGDELASRLDGWVGLFVSRRGRRNVVAAVSPWLPADRAGIEVGEVLLSVDGRDVAGLGPRATGFLLRGPVGTTASIVAQTRAGDLRKIALPRVLR
jgi:hypothetical protein